MGHDAHFLERLDRVTDVQVELALRLYRDHELLRYLFTEARVSDVAGRVAVSLDHDTEGPFIVVTRGGAFVTCLGRGMSPRPHPIITRAALDAASRHLEKLRLTIAASAAIDDGARRGVNLWLRIYQAADRLSREEFSQLAAIQPLVDRRLLADYFKLHEAVEERRRLLAPIQRARPQDTRILRQFWNDYHALGHLLMLCALSGPKLVESFTGELTALRELITMPCTAMGMRWTSTRAIWAAAKLGKPLLGPQKSRFGEASDPITVLDAGFALGGLVCRHARMRAEVQKSMRAHVRTERGSPATEYRRYFATMMEHLVDAGDGLIEGHEQEGRVAASEWTCENRLPGHPYRYATPEEVPRHIAMWWVPNMHGAFGNNVVEIGNIVRCIPWIARARAEDFYLPDADAAGLNGAWGPTSTLEVLAAMAVKPKKRAPLVIEAQVGRNCPCRCGSGKKSKRCCAA